MSAKIGCTVGPLFEVRFPGVSAKVIHNMHKTFRYPVTVTLAEMESMELCLLSLLNKKHKFNFMGFVFLCFVLEVLLFKKEQR